MYDTGNYYSHEGVNYSAIDQKHLSLLKHPDSGKTQELKQLIFSLLSADHEVLNMAYYQCIIHKGFKVVKKDWIEVSTMKLHTVYYAMDATNDNYIEINCVFVLECIIHSLLQPTRIQQIADDVIYAVHDGVNRDGVYQIINDGIRSKK